MKSKGQIAYEAYCEKRNGIAFNGTPLPPWGDQQEPLKVAWEAAAKAVLDEKI